MPLVLVENERTAGGLYDSWRDITGSLYHFPNVYRPKIKAGEQFVYYRGVRRRVGRRPHPEYFGTGRIREVWRDDEISASAPKRKWKWYCSISDYSEFAQPVNWKHAGQPFEQIPRNLFGNGVRSIPDDVFQQILAYGGTASVPSSAANDFQTPIAVDFETHAEIERVKATTYRVLRDTPLARTLKQLHGNRCQVCGETVVLRDGKLYSEAHHIRPLGRPHNGPDVAPNILVLCPIHHVLCDYGAMEISLSEVRIHPGHPISPNFINYHNDVICGRGAT